MNILVTGADGFLGSNIAKYLAPNHRVIGLYHDMHHNSTPGVIAVHGNITDFHRMLEIINDREIDIIYHCAAKSIVRNCVHDPLGCFNTNVMGVATILEAARQSERIKGIMVMESDKVYGPGPIPYREDQMLTPQGVYEASKACASQIVRAYYYNYGLPVFGIRSANIYGPGDPNLSRIVPNTILRLLSGKAPQIVEGAKNYVREYIYVEDAVKCVTGLMEKKPWGESINIGSGEYCEVYVLMTTIQSLMGNEGEFEIISRQSSFKEIPEQYLDLSKLISLLPHFKPTPLEVGLKATIDWYKSKNG